jgi:hypothetical protein
MGRLGVLKGAGRSGPGDANEAVAIFALLAVQQSWVKRRAIGIAPQPAQSSLVFPSPVTNSFASHIGSA